MLLYIIIVKPFNKGEGNFINIYNEFIIVFSFFSVLIMSNYEFSDLIVNIWGWILTIPVVFSLLITWYFSLPQMIGELKETITNCFTKKPDKVKKKSKKMKTEQAKNADKVRESEYSNINRMNYN